MGFAKSLKDVIEFDTFKVKIPGEGNGNPLQYSCLENPMDGEAWLATVHGVAKSRTQLSDFSVITALYQLSHKGMGFPDSSAGKESACNVGDPGSIPRLERSAGEGISYPPQYSWASLVAQLMRNPPAMWETWV